MTVLAAVCGVLIVCFGILFTGKAPTDAQFGIEVTAVVGGLLLCFLAVVLSRLKSLDRKIEALQNVRDAEAD